METKICFKCKEEKNISNFSKGSRNKDGLQAHCKECSSLLYQAYKTSGLVKKNFRKTNLKGICAKCKKERLATSKFCLYHFIYSIVNKWKIPKDKIEQTIEGLINKLEDSEYCCHYSGLKIVPGFSASVDHRIAQSKGGTHELSNLVWCHSQINRMKGSLSEKEFINCSANILVELNYLDSKGQL